MVDLWFDIFLKMREKWLLTFAIQQFQWGPPQESIFFAVTF